MCSRYSQLDEHGHVEDVYSARLRKLTLHSWQLTNDTCTTPERHHSPHKLHGDELVAMQRTEPAPVAYRGQDSHANIVNMKLATSSLRCPTTQRVRHSMR